MVEISRKNNARKRYNRMTIDNLKSAGWQIKIDGKLSSDIVRWIEEKP